MGKTRSLFKKIRNTKGTFHAKMGSIKDRNGRDLTEAEDIKKRWQDTRYIRWIIEKAREFKRNIYLCFFLTIPKPLTVQITTNWKILQEMGLPDHLTCLLKNLYSGQEAKLKLDMEQQTGSKLGKQYVKAVYCYPAYLSYM